MDPLLFIVSRDEHDLHDYLTKEFRRDEHILVILDRRRADRRRRAEPRHEEQRRTARRRALMIEQQMKSVGFAVVRGLDGH